MYITLEHYLGIEISLDDNSIAGGLKYLGNAKIVPSEILLILLI